MFIDFFYGQGVTFNVLGNWVLDTRQVFQNELGEITPLEELLIILFMEELDKCYGERKDCLMETILSME